MLLYPTDLDAVVDALAGALGRELPERRVREALDRLDAVARRSNSGRGSALARSASAHPGEGHAWGQAPDREWAEALAVRTSRVVRGRAALDPRAGVDLMTIDDDLGGPYPPPARTTFAETLRAAGMELRETDSPTPDRSLVVALYADIRGWKGRPGLSARAVEALVRVLGDRPDALVVLFGHPRLADEVPGRASVVVAWGGEPLMQLAAARWLSKDNRNRGNHEYGSS
jgi:hypothetical protein